MKMSCPRFDARYLPHTLTACLAVILGCLAVNWNFPCPLVDDAFYKSPAAELAQNGRLTIPCSAGFLPRMDEVFACYPPLYQLILAGWYALFGVTLHTSLAFSFCVHALNSLLIVEVSRRILREHEASFSSLDWLLPTTVGVIHLCNLAYFDRQEELALVFVFFQLLVAWQKTPRCNFGRQLLIGVCGGCAALTSPWVGMLAVALICTRDWLSVWQDETSPVARRIAFSFARLSSVATIFALMITVWFLTIEHFYPGVIREQFLGILKHLNTTQKTAGVGQRLATLYESLSYSRGQLPVTAVVFGGMIVCFATCDWRRLSPNVGALFTTAIGGTCLLVWKRPEAYTYFGAIQILSLPCFAFVAAQFFVERVGSIGSAPRLSLLGKAVFAASVLLAVRDTATHAYYAMRLPQDERAAKVFAHLHERIPTNARVAVTARHWLAFQGRNAWRETFFSSLESPAEVLKCDWLVMEAERGRPYFLDQFELVEKVAPSTPACHTYAFSLYKRRGVAPSSDSEVVPTAGVPGFTLTRESVGR